MRSFSLARSLLGAVCFVGGAIALAIHPNRSWREITGEPEDFTISTESSEERKEWGA